MKHNPNYLTALNTARLSAAIYPGGELAGELVKQGFTDAYQCHNDRYDALASVATDGKTVVVVFRGTAGEKNVLCDADVFQDQVPDSPEGVRLHGGFAKVFAALWPDVSTAYQKCHPVGCYRRVVVTGHSMGGALAMIAADRLRAAACYTFGQPRTGNGAWRGWFNWRNPDLEYYRFVDQDDFVPRVPWLCGGYRHAGARVLIDWRGNMVVDPPLWKTLKIDIAGTFTEAWKGRMAMWEDHHVARYVGALDRWVAHLKWVQEQPK